MKSLKTFLLLFIMLICSYQLSAQDIPNADFEQWDTYTGYVDPADWDTPNLLTYVAPFYVLTTTQSTDSYSGTYAVRMESQTILSFVVPGLLTLGQLSFDMINQTSEISGGIPFNQRPSFLRGYYKYTPATGDNALAAVFLTSYDTESCIRDTVAQGGLLLPDTIDIYSQFEVILEYYSVLTPDTMNIIIMPTAGLNTVLGSVMLVDSVWLDYTGAPYVNLGNDTTIIQGSVLTLDAGSGNGYTYEWHKDMQPEIIGSSQTFDVTTEGLYSVIVRNVQGLPAFDTIQVWVSQGIGTITGRHISISPNPGNGKYRLLIPESLSIILVELYNTNGKFAGNAGFRKTGRSEMELDISGFPNGIYYLRAVTSDESYITKIILQR